MEYLHIMTFAHARWRSSWIFTTGSQQPTVISVVVNIASKATSIAIQAPFPLLVSAAFHGPFLCCQDAFVANEDLSDNWCNLALSGAVHAAPSYRCSRFLNDYSTIEIGTPDLRLIQLFLENGARVNDTLLILVMAEGPPSLLKLLLDHESAGEVKLQTAAGSPCGLLHLFATFGLFLRGF